MIGEEKIPVCPVCRSRVNKKGFCEGKQRYICKDKDCAYKTINPIWLDSNVGEIISSNVKYKKETQKSRDLNRISNKSFREFARIENAIIEYNKNLIALLQKKNISKAVNTHRCKVSNECVPVLHITDAHFNELVNLLINKYDFPIAAKRVQKLIQQTKLHLKPFNVTNIVVALTGDLLNSDRRRDELLSMATNRSKASLLAVDILTAALLDLNKDYNVSVFSVSGNESRKPFEMGYSEMVATDNYDYTIVNILSRVLGGRKGLEFKSGDQNEQVINVNGANVLLKHGYDYPNDPEKDVLRTKGRYARRGVMLDLIIFGHLHTANIGDGYARGGSIVGANAYSENKLNVEGLASQNLHLVFPDKSINSIRIDLQNTEGYEGYSIDDDLGAYNAKSEKKATDKKVILEITI